MKAIWVTIGGLLLLGSGAAVVIPGGGADPSPADRVNSFLSPDAPNAFASGDAKPAMSGTRFDPTLDPGVGGPTGPVGISRPTTAVLPDAPRTSPFDAPRNTARNQRPERPTTVNPAPEGSQFRSRERQLERQKIIEDRQREMTERRAMMNAQREQQAQARLGNSDAQSGVGRVTPQQTQTEGVITTGGTTGGGASGGQTGGGTGGGGTGGTGSNGGSSGSGSGSGGAGNGGGSGAGNGGGSGGSGGGGGPSTGGDNLQAQAVWIPVDNTSCDEVAGYKTADLYVRFNQTVSVLTVQSKTGTGLSITGGSFAQHPHGTNTPPSDGQITSDPCIDFDSYLAINDAALGFAPPEPGLLDWGTELVAVWFTPGGSSAVQDRPFFGDSGFYVRVARITAPAGDTKVSGAVTLSARSAGTATPIRTVTVTVANDSSMWAGTPPTGNPFGSSGSAGGGGSGGGDDGGTGGGTDGGTGGGTDGGTGGGTDGGTGGGTDGGSGGGTDGETGGGTDGGTGGGSGDDDDCPVWPDPYFDSIPGITGVWVPVDNTEAGCEALEGFKTADLYFRMGAPSRVLTVTSGQNTNSGLHFTGPSPLQLTGGLNTPFPADFPQNDPCLVYDSWVSIGVVLPSIIGVLDPTNWGQSLNIVWFTTATENASQMPELFDDCAYYIRVARLTIIEGPDSGAEGQLSIGYVLPGSGSSQSAVVEIPNCHDCFAESPAP